MTLAHTVSYLVSEQLAGLRYPTQDNRDAIALICEAGRRMAGQERRQQAYHVIASWLPTLSRRERSASAYVGNP